jgi:hypothetical protein
MARAAGSNPRFAEDDLPPEEDAIDCLYAELSGLYAQKEAAPLDRQLDKRIEQTFQRLRAAQADEVLRLRRSFEAGLRMPLGAGTDLVAQVDRMRRGKSLD